MLRTRVIPVLLLKEDALVKTVKFAKPSYIGDPINTVRIFNELEVDELCFLDITASAEKRPPNLRVLEGIANECFMPLSYGGGLVNLEVVKRVFGIGIEKVVLNTATHNFPSLIGDIVEHYGSQALVASVDVKRGLLGGYDVRANSGKVSTGKDPVQWACDLERMGVGEILLTSIDREGTWNGFDVDLVRRVSEAVSIPVIAHGGAGHISHLTDVVKNGQASAVALGSMVVYQQKGMGVLINFPDSRAVAEALT